ncbi:MAG: capsid cement protein, partial [Parcubacteria group bacterium]
MAETKRTRDYVSCYENGYNGSGTDIVAGYVLKDDATNLDGVALATASTDTLVGVSTETMTDGMTTSYQMDGVVKVYSGGVIAKGDLLTVDSTSRVVKASAPSTTAQNYVGRAKTAAGAAGVLVEVVLFKVQQSWVGASTVATRTALKSLAAADRYNGQLVLVQEDGSLWRFNSTSTQVEDTADELVQTPGAGTGRWVRADKAFVMKVPCSKDSTDALAIETIPAGMTLKLTAHPWWEVTTGFTGGSSSAIGISTSLTGYDTKGDLLGGASGELT